MAAEAPKDEPKANEGELSEADLNELVARGVSDAKSDAAPAGKSDRFSETITGSSDESQRVRDATKHWPHLRFPTLQDFLTQSGYQFVQKHPNIKLKLFTDLLFPRKPIAMLIINAREETDLPERMKIKTTSDLRNIIVVLDATSVCRVLLI